jgi:glycosyltransferase involved in cell wall biosynthesis
MQFGIVHAAKSLALAPEFDIVHNHAGPPFDIVMGICSLIDTPMLTTLHNQPSEDTAFIWHNYDRWYNAISRSQLAGLAALPKAHCAGYVYNGIDVDSFPFRPEKADYVLFIGRLSEIKAPHLAVEAARKADIPIVIAGKMSTVDEREYYESVLNPLIDGHNVIFAGEADAVTKRELYAGAMASLAPLQWEEPFGLILVESLACGTPVIAFPRGAAPELISDGATGFLVEDVDAMAEALKRIPSIDPRACRAHVEAHFSPTALADAYLSVYERMLAGGPEILQEDPSAAA